MVMQSFFFFLGGGSTLVYVKMVNLKSIKTVKRPIQV